MKLEESFYYQDTTTVAKKLLGKRLVRVYKGQRISGIITETEAYLGISDRACHSYKGKKTEKIKSMYLSGGHSYVYLIYGIHYCFNVVTRTTEHPEAVLIRALQPDENIELMKKFRATDQLHNLTTGPGKLCKALQIAKEHDGITLHDNEFFIEDNKNIPAGKIIATPRIGIPYAEEAIHWPLRFYIKDNLFITKK